MNNMGDLMGGNKNKYPTFIDFPNAFDYCREANRPVRVVIIGNMAWKLYKMYPSGKADYIRVVPQGGE